MTTNNNFRVKNALEVGGSVVIDSTGTWVGSPTGLVGPQGDKGDKGDTGDTGATGDTGPKGDKGDTGDTGPQGDQGLQGDKGDKGDTGDQGLTGDTGPKGDTGDKGDKGDTGDTGPQGDKGDKGDTGDTGPQGDQGLKGDTGDQGIPGNQGDPGTFSGTLDQDINLNGYVLKGGSYTGNTISLPTGFGPIITNGYEDAITLQSSSDNTTFQQWKFRNNGELIFPDTSVQTTAYTGTFNIFNQSLNSTDNVVFSQVSFYGDETSQTTAWLGTASYNVSDFNNDAGYLTSATVNDYISGSRSTNTFTTINLDGITLSNNNGILTALTGAASGGNYNITSDTALFLDFETLTNGSFTDGAGFDSGSQYFIDPVSNNPVGLIGSVTLSTAQVKFGTYSVYFGSGNTGVFGGGNLAELSATPDQAIFDSIGQGPATIDSWIYIPTADAVNGFQGILTTNGHNDSIWGISGDVGSKVLALSWAGHGPQYFGTITIPQDQWVHIAYIRDNSNNWYGAVNGQTELIINTTNLGFGFNNFTTIGSNGWGNSFTGYMDNFRISKAVILSANGFIPPGTVGTLVNALPTTTATSQLVNDSGFITSSTFGDIAFQGSWIRNKDTGGIYISPQDGQTWLNLPSDDQASGNPIQIANAAGGGIQLYDGTGSYTFNTNGITFPDSTVQTTAFTGGGIDYSTATNIILGLGAGLTPQANTIAIGYDAGFAGALGDNTIAIGFQSGANQAANAIAIGNIAGNDTQGSGAVAIGYAAGQFHQGAGAVAIGEYDGASDTAGAGQGDYAVAIGAGAGQYHQGANAIAIGYLAGKTDQTAGSIILNASGSEFNDSGNAGFYVNPIRNAIADNIVCFNTTTNELTYATAPVQSVQYWSTATLSTASTTTALIALVTNSGEDSASTTSTNNIPAFFDGAIWRYMFNLEPVTIIAGGGGGGGGGIAGTSLLLHGEDLTDSSTLTNTLTAYGDVAASSSQSVFGGSSIYFNGNPSNHLDVAYNSALEFGSGDWTVEFWIYRNSLAGGSPINVWGPSASDQSWYFRDSDGVPFVFFDDTGVHSFSMNISQETGAWHHVAIVRNGSTITAYSDGTATGSGTVTGNMGNNTNHYGINLGWNANAGPNSYFALNGYLDEVRIVIGTAVYTEAFTVPTAAFGS